ncbi:hypothetical protein Btru_005821 [Bulinus truncatus]|nr:hypothetical protein Btru_005821 [Bulinus truncatus]
MSLRADDPSLTPGQRKRPLSIIQEHDSGDDTLVPEVPDAQSSREFKACATVSKETTQSAEYVPKKPEQSVNLVSLDLGPVIYNTPKGGSAKQKNKNEANKKPISSSTPKPRSPQPLSPIPNTDVKIPGWKKKKHRSSKKTVTASLSDPTSKSFQNKQNLPPAQSATKQNLPPAHSATKPQRNKRKSQEKLNNGVANGGAPIVLTGLKTNENIPLAKVVSDGNGLARIRETAERLNLTSSSSSSSLTTLTTSPKLGHLFRINQASSAARPVPECIPVVIDSVPQITITCSSGTVKLSPEDEHSPGNTNSSVNAKLSGRFSYLTSKYSSSKHGSSYFNRRVRNDSVGSLSESELSEGSAGVADSSDDAAGALGSDLKRLQETTEKLHLSPRRPSIMQWRQKYMESPESPMLRRNVNGEVTEEKLTSDRKQRINDALEWLRNELQEMRSQDQTLARQLLSIRHDLHKLKLRRCTEQHQDLIDEFQSELEDIQEFSYVLDIPQPVYGNNPLKHIGVTRMNLSARRFSAC